MIKYSLYVQKECFGCGVQCSILAHYIKFTNFLIKIFLFVDFSLLFEHLL